MPRIIRHNVVAKDLRTPKYRPRVLKSKKIYSRKGRKERIRSDG